MYISVVRISPMTTSCPSYLTINKDCLALTCSYFVPLPLHYPTWDPSSQVLSFQEPEDLRYMWNTWTVIEGRCSTWAEANIQYWHDPTWSKFPVEWHSAATIMTQCIEAFEKLQVQCGIINPLKIPLHSNVRWGTAYQMLSVSYNIRHICHPSYYCSCNYPSRCRQSISSLPLLIIAMAISQLFNVRAMWSKRYRGLPFSLPIRTGEWCKMPHKSLW